MSAPADASLAVYRGRRALVLGASGFIGRWVARSLCQRHADVALAVRDRRAAEALFARYQVEGAIHETDLCDFEAVTRLIRAVGPSIVFNLAGYGVDRTEQDEQAAYAINARLVRCVAQELATGHDTKWSGQNLVHAGSVLEYGSIDEPLTEDHPARPTTLYGKSKLAGSAFLASESGRLGIKAVTARLFTVYGPGEHPGRLLPSLLDTARSGYALCLTAGSQVRDFTYVADVAEGLLRLGLSAAAGGTVVHLTRGRPLSVRAFVETARNLLHIPPDLLKFGTISTHWVETDRLDVPLDRLRRLIGWVPPTDIPEGIRRTVKFESDGESPTELVTQRVRTGLDG